MFLEEGLFESGLLLAAVTVGIHAEPVAGAQFTEKIAGNLACGIPAIQVRREVFGQEFFVAVEVIGVFGRY